MEARSYVCRSYRWKTDRGPFCPLFGSGGSSATPRKLQCLPSFNLENSVCINLTCHTIVTWVSSPLPSTYSLPERKSWEKWNFESIYSFAHTIGVWTLGKALLRLLLFYLQMLIMQISTQTGNYEYSKKVTNKRVHFLKNGSEVLKP